MPRIDPVVRCIRRGGFAIALLASLLPASDGRAQAAACMPTQTVGAQADANGVYTTTLTCADTSAAAGAADYRQLHYNHGAAYGANPADRDTTLTNNNQYNNLALTIGRGVIFTADGYNDNRLTVTDGAILLWNAGAKTVTVEDGAVINLERTPAYWTATDPDRPMSATPEYDPAWYPTWRHALDNLVGIGAYSYTGTDGDADIAIGHHGVIDIDIDIGGTYGKNGYYDASAGRAIDVQVKDTGGAAAARADLDVLIEMGATGVIRHVEGSDGLSGIYAENFSEEGDIRIDLAEGSLIDVSEGGGYGVTALLRRDATNNNGQRTGDLIVNAAGTIRAAARSRVQSFQHGYGIFADQGGHTGRVRVVSSGTIETVQGPAIDARAWRSTQTHRDDPDTAEIEGHIVDVTAGTVETRGTTAVYASTGSANSHMTVRVAEGAAVRAQALTDEDYASGALTQETLGADGSPYIIPGIYRYHGWRRVDVEQTTDSGATVTVKRLEPIITGIAIRDFSSSPNADGLRDRVLVDGTVETVGGKAGVDPAIWLESGGLVTVGANGRVSADSGIAISGGCFTDYRKVDFVNIDSPVDCDTAAPRTLEVRVAGTVEGDIRVLDDGVLNFRSMEGGTVAGTVHDPAGPLTVAGSVGRLLYSSGGAVTVTRTGALTGVEVDGGTEALRSESGDLSLTVAGMGMVTGDVRARGGGRLTVDVKEGGTIAGTVHDPAGPLTVAGNIGRVLYSSGGAVTVTGTGRLTGVDGVALRSESGDLSLTVAGKGMVTGDVQARGDGRLTVDVKEGGTIAGTVHDPAGPLTVAGSVGRVLYSSGGAVTVTGAGRLTGVDGVALRSESGDLSLTVAGKGMVTGDVQARGGGRLTLDLKAGGTVAGTVHDPAGPLTVAGSIGRLLYSSGGAVTVTGAGRLTGVDGVALRSESGNLSLTVADKGMVTGDVQARGGGRLTLDLKEGGTVSGTVHDPAGPLTVAGSIGRLLYTNGAAVTVTDTGRLTGVEVDGRTVALRSEAGDVDLTVAGMATGDIDARGDGDLTVSVSGTVDGDIFGRGAGEHTVTVARGGAVTGTVHLGASAVTADGAVGRVRFDRGGAATVGSTGRISGIDGVAVDSRSGDLTVTVAGLAMGDIDGRGGGDLTVMVSGTVDGDVFGREAGEHAVTVERGGAITGTVDLAGDGAVTVEGAAGRIDFERDGTVTVGPEGRISGRDDVAIKSSSGAPAVTIVASAGESLGDAVGRVGGAIVAAEGEPSVMLGREGETGSITLGGLGTARSVPEGAYDVGVVRTASGALRAVSRLAPRTRVYEALPSVLLGMERPASHADRAAAPRASDGAWARVAASRGSWEAASSANAGTEYDHRGFSFQAGVDAVLGEETRAGLSVHVRRATAKVSHNGGEIEARGAGVGLSATWSPGPFFVDGQAAATLYDVDLDSSLRGRLKDDAGAQGLSAALEAGRMVPVADGVTVTPRARVAYSSLSLSDFVDDAAGARVSLDRGRSLTGRAGALAERVFGEGRIFGSLDIEREFSAETRMSVAGTSLETAGEATRWLVGVGGEHGWEDGRFALRGALDYASSGGGARDYGARASLSMRF